MKVKTEDARRQASKTITEARRQARSTARDARKQAQRKLVQARIAAARTRSGARAKASRVSTKAVAAVGVIGLIAGYFLRGRGAGRTQSTGEYRTGQIDGEVAAADSQTPTEEPGASSREPSLST
jgi:hypothetical protein